MFLTKSLRLSVLIYLSVCCAGLASYGADRAHDPCHRRLPRVVNINTQHASPAPDIIENWQPDLSVRIDLDARLNSPLADRGGVVQLTVPEYSSNSLHDIREDLLFYERGTPVTCIADANHTNISSIIVIASGYDTSTQALDGVPLLDRIFSQSREHAVCLIDLPAQGLNMHGRTPHHRDNHIYSDCLSSLSSPFTAYRDNYISALTAINSHYPTTKKNIIALSISAVPMLQAAMTVNDPSFRGVYLLSPYVGMRPGVQKSVYQSIVRQLFGRTAQLGVRHYTDDVERLRDRHGRILRTELLRLFTEGGAISEQINPTNIFVAESNTLIASMDRFLAERTVVPHFQIGLVAFSGDAEMIDPFDRHLGLLHVLDKHQIRHTQPSYIDGDGHNMLTEPDGVEYLARMLSDSDT